jgi:hypothetical protein
MAEAVSLPIQKNFLPVLISMVDLLAALRLFPGTLLILEKAYNKISFPGFSR